MKKISKRWLSALMVLILILGLIPMSQPIEVQAAATSGAKFYNPADTGTTDGRTNYQKVYYANNIWRVLEVDAKEHQELFLLSDGIDETDWIIWWWLANSDYLTSGIRSVLRGEYMDYFSATEKSAISKQNIILHEGPDVATPSDMGDSVFILSNAEAMNSRYFPKGDADRKLDRAWVIRNKTGSFLAGSNGSIPAEAAAPSVRPALKLQLSSILFSSNSKILGGG